MTCDILDIKPTRSLLFVSPGYDPNGYFRWMYDDIIRHVAEPLRFTCLHAPDVGLVPPKFHRQLEELQRFDLAIFLLDGHDPNVAFRLGLRYASTKPLITLHSLNTLIPGDLAHTDSIPIGDGGMREDSRTRLKQRICDILVYPDSCTGRPLLEMVRDGLVTPRAANGRFAPLHRFKSSCGCSGTRRNKGRFG